MEDNFKLRRLIQDELEKCGIRVPIEEKFDYSQFDKPEILKKFVKLCYGDWRHAIYIKKNGERYGDNQYFDLLFQVDKNSYPICIPVPIARKLFNEEISANSCVDTMKGSTYEKIYRYYYENRELPF